MKKLFLFLAAFIILANISFTCWYDDSDGYYSFFNIESIADPTLILFVDYEAGLGLGYSEKAKDPADGNLEDWKKYLSTNISEADILKLVYQMKLEDLEKLLKNKAALKAAAADNAILALWQKDQKLKNTIGNYLLYAKKCEIEALKSYDYWEDNKSRDMKQLQKLIDEGNAAYVKEKDVFLKNRYAFQIIRAAFFMNQHDRVKEYFAKFFAAVPENYIYFRALEILAGAQNISQSPEAAANYARVFVNCPDRRNVCVNSFSISNADDWNKSLAFCKSKEEKAAFFAMRGLKNQSNIIEELEQIAEIAPESQLMEMLTARYIGKLQKQAFPNYLSEPTRFPKNNLSNHEGLKRLQLLMKKMSEQKNIANADFWLLAAAYSNIMCQKTEEAIQVLTKIPSGSKYYIQAEVMTLAAKLVAVEKLDNNTAARLLEALKASEILKNNADINEFFKDVFSLHFINQGDKARAFLAYHNLYTMRNRLDLIILEALEVFLENYSAKNTYDTYLIETRCGSLSNAKNVVNELKGLYFLQRNKLDEAIIHFEKCDKAHRQYSPYFKSDFLNKSIWFESVKRPFYNLDINAQNVKFLYEKHSILNKDYDLLSYTKTLKSLEETAVKDKSAENYYLLGLAWYNTGVLGWHRPAIYMTSDNTGSSNWWLADEKMEYLKFYKHYSWTIDMYYNPDIAAAYLEKAIELTKDDEIKARALYMLAEVEKSRDLSKIFNYWGETPPDNKRYYECFKELKKLSNTEFYKKVQRECYDFSVYSE